MTTLALVYVVIFALQVQERHLLPWHIWPVLPLAPIIVGVIWYGSSVRRFRLQGAELLIERRWHTSRFPLAGLTAVDIDRDALRGAWKIWGTDGLGAYAGRFHSKKLGGFRAHLTDPERAVVLRWPASCLVISPKHPNEFADAVRARLAEHP